MSGYLTRPLSDRAWMRPASARRRSLFRAGWADTEPLLLAELDHLDAVDVVLELDVLPSHLRVGGGLKARAAAGAPVRLACSTPRGPLLFASDLHPAWQDNVRAIALTLTALRAVDRYGVAGSGEQYRGWAAIEAAPAALADPLEVLVEASGVSRSDVENAYHHPTSTAPMEKVLRLARRRAHPDTGGSAAAWNRVQAAAATLGLT